MPNKKVSTSIKLFFAVIISLIIISFLFLPNLSIYTSTTTTIETSTTTTTAAIIPVANKSLTREVFLDTKSGEGLLWFSNATVDDVRSAMKIWEEKTNRIINFEEVRGESVADIKIKFSESFNVSSTGKKIIGEAFIYLGEVRGIIYIMPSAMSCRNQVRVMHEIGHIIGLNHSIVYSSVMYPTESCVQNITDEDAKAAIELINQFL